ncbi:MAG: hypothetical protein HY774_01935 [Acidobacteria bacterium]|nr:hypothetical protein [Acidobacteriota bacterium]
MRQGSQWKVIGKNVRLVVCLFWLLGACFLLGVVDLIQPSPAVSAQSFLLDEPIHSESRVNEYKRWFRLTEEPTYAPMAMPTG